MSTFPHEIDRPAAAAVDDPCDAGDQIAITVHATRSQKERKTDASAESAELTSSSELAIN